MKIISVSLLILLVCSCNRPKESIPNTYLLRSAAGISVKNDIVFLDNKKYSGFLLEISPTHDTLSAEGYINGMLSGVCKKWYPNNRLKEEREYIDGKKNGRQVAYWENGRKRFEFTAKNDAYEGEFKEWGEDGHLFHLANYVNGQEEGAQKMWYNNGKIRANYVIIKGKRYGLLGTKNCKNVSDSVFSGK